MLKTVADRMEAMGIHLDAGDEAVKELAKEGFDPKYGARPLRRAIQNQVEDAVAEKMLEGSLKEGGTAKLTVADGKLTVEAEAQPEAKTGEPQPAPGRGEGLGGWHPGL